MQAAQFAAIDRRLLSHEKDIAELKDLGRKCFGFTALDKSNISDILAKI